MDWVFDHGFLPEGPIEAVDSVIAATGAILTGRASYDVGDGGQRPEMECPFGCRRSGPNSS